MYCKQLLVELQQKRIRLNDEIYSCRDGEVMMNCCDDDEICRNFTGEDNHLLFHINGTLYSNSFIFCNDTNDEIIQCYFGQLPSDSVAFIPTMRPPPHSQQGDENARMSGFMRIYNYFIQLIGLSSSSTTTTTSGNFEKSQWIPQPLEIPPEPITTAEPHVFLVKSSNNENNNKPLWHFYRSLSDVYLRSEKLKVPMSSFERNNVRSFTISEYNNMKANGEVVDF
jgi:hypothetical protein